MFYFAIFVIPDLFNLRGAASSRPALCSAKDILHRILWIQQINGERHHETESRLILLFESTTTKQNWLKPLLLMFCRCEENLCNKLEALVRSACYQLFS